MDRDKALAVLDPLTVARDTETLAQLKHSGLASLEEMARWNAASYARMAYQLIGRIAGLTDAAIEKTWNDGNAARERIITAANQRR